MHGQVQMYSGLSTLQDGSGVCYSRIVQTFTAKMLGKVGSEHLAPPFIEMSEECYGDIADNLQGQLEETFPIVGQKVARMAREVYWLHEKLGIKIINLAGREQGIPISLENQFAKVESLNDEVGRAMEDRKVLVLKKFSLYATILLISSLLLLVALGKYVMGEFLTARQSRQLEQMAGRRPDYSTVDSLEELGLASVVGKILLGLKNKIYSYGVYVDIDIPEHLAIWGRSEAVFQIIYDLLTTELDNVRQAEEGAKVTICGRAAGKKVILSLNHNGAAYGNKLVSQVNRKGKSRGLPSELLIARELLKDLGGKIILSNGEHGSQMELIFKRAQDRKVGALAASPRSVSRLVKGNKRELLKNLSL